MTFVPQVDHARSRDPPVGHRVDRSNLSQQLKKRRDLYIFSKVTQTEKSGIFSTLHS